MLVHNPAKISSNKLLYVLREFVLFDVSLVIYINIYIYICFGYYLAL